MPFIGNKPTAVPLTSADLADSIITSAKIADGTIASVDLATGVGGKVLQVVSTTKTDTFSTSTTSSWVDVTGLTVNITPTSTSNKVFIVGNVMGSNPSNQCFWRLVRNTTPIFVGDTSGSRTSSSGGNFYNGDASGTKSEPISYLDSPSSTSSITYKIQIISQSASSHINRSTSDTDEVNRNRSASTITVMEIAG